MSRYPEECPVFRVTMSGPLLRRGALVEGMGPFESVTGYLAVRLLTEEKWCGTGTRYADGWYGAALLADEHLQPLTRAARDLLALVTP